MRVLLSLLAACLLAGAGAARADAAFSVSIQGYGSVNSLCSTAATTPDTTASACGAPSASCTVSESPDHTFSSELCTATATAGPAPAGWAFAGWTGSCTTAATTCAAVTSETECDYTGPKPPCRTVTHAPRATAVFRDTRPAAFTLLSPDQALVVDGAGRAALRWATDEDATERPSFTCSVDGQPATACTSPLAVGGLGDGTHTLAVTAQDPSPEQRASTSLTWDQETPVTVTVDSAPPATTGATTATLAFHTNKTRNVSYSCTLSSGGAVVATDPFCSSPKVFTGLPDRSYRATVTATFAPAFGGALTSSAQSTDWLVDTAAPDTTLSGGPSEGTLTTDRAATFQIASEPGAQLQCALDGAAFAACPATVALTGLDLGSHTFRARAVDAAGNADASPAARTWSIVAPSPAGQLAPGNAPLVAGVNAQVSLQQGRVTITLPSGSVVPLDGIASVPVGSVVDARKGALTLRSAPRTAGGRPGEATLTAGIFRIRQQRTRNATTDFVMVSPPGARTCAKPAAKGAVRTLSVTASKGVFRTVGGAATVTAPSSTGRWTTTDSCAGTRTTVRRGKVAVIARGHSRPVTVSAGRSLLVRARLFAARQHG
jgi:hypothetical protein